MESLPPEMEKTAETEEVKECATFPGKIAQELQAQGVNITHQCVEGLPAREIIAYAHTNDIDLIALATHGRGEVAWILGSTAEKVVAHATVPTLLFRVMDTKVPGFKETLVEMP